MNNNRYNLRSSAGQQQQQQQVASSTFSTSSTAASMPVSGPATTVSTGLSTSLLSSASNTSQTTFQTGQQQPPPPFAAQQRQQQQQQHSIFQTQTNSNQPLETIPYHYQHQQVPGQSMGVSMGGPAATAPFLQDFTLVAEAVKRVQMDAVMTEMESITL